MCDVTYRIQQHGKKACYFLFSFVVFFHEQTHFSLSPSCVSLTMKRKNIYICTHKCIKKIVDFFFEYQNKIVKNSFLYFTLYNKLKKMGKRQTSRIEVDVEPILEREYSIESPVDHSSIQKSSSSDCQT